MAILRLPIATFPSLIIAHYPSLPSLLHLITMGLFTAPAPTQLVPANPPIAVFRDFIAQAPTTLVLKEKVWSLSGDSFSIKDAATGRPVVKVAGKALSLRDRKQVMDPSGRPLYSLRSKLMTIFNVQIGEDANEKELFRVRSHSLSLGSKLTVTFTNAITGQPVELNIKGDMFGMGSVIRCNGQPIAQISREYFNAAQIFGDQQTYFVTVAPGVDLALIAGICMAFDEAENEAK
ncbi:hypothetical protein CC85DRAFT_283526 [Cutaneotrichosporon oleaginosum]|uniref:DUF567-domain-containing protein n=1 Tax=Cutaneotrichosporon oleaginosum TaxID=879819 RepID=A0A0J0XU64_9TREE|nr:uncharacterized protein CC85DRAFT_283526 [Cutaneotrichosporon oleaginosum]KLT44592.1 hypothetical protein CC85DRAFT_283526 [Cutaneotrichosporon oleaginosum]TXT13893.1 hypothetical protein COLE_00086 [Cutaneotrichosporon oleaginosum]